MLSADRRRTSVTFRILSVGILLGLLICAAFIGVIRVDLNNTRDAARRSASIVATSYATHLSRVLATADVLSTVVSYEYGKSPSTFNLKSLVDGATLTPDAATQITIVDADGKSTQTWPYPLSGAIYLSDRPHFVVQKNSPTAGFFVGAPVKGRISGKWTIQFTRRLNSGNGHFDGVVVVSESPEYLAEGFISSALIGANGALLAFRRDGEVLARQTLNGPADPAGPPLGDYMSALDNASGELTDPVDHSSRFFAYAAVPGYPVVAAVEISQDEVFNGFRQRRVVYAVFGALFLALIAFAVVSFLRYVNALIAAEEKMRHLSETDALTELGNRRSLRQAIEAAFSQEAVPPDSIALLALDLSDFGRINDLLGQDAGDALLRLVAGRLKEVVADRVRLARVGGDEFSMLVEGPNALSRSLGLARAIIDAFGLAFGLRGHSYVIKVCIGVASNSSVSSSVSELWRNANRAMAEAKKLTAASAESEVRSYTVSMAEQGDQHERDFHALLGAMQKKTMTIEYSPVVESGRGSAVAYHAAMIWHRPDVGRCLPEAFFPLAAQHDLLFRLGTHQIEEACRQISVLPGPLSVPVCVSIPAAVVMQGDLGNFIDYVLESTGFDAQRLWLGIEDAPLLVGNPQALATLHRLKERGVTLYAAGITGDDWSISGIRALSVSAVEIGADLLAQVTVDRVAGSVVAGILTSCASLGLTVLAAGVDSQEALDWLNKHHDDVWAYGSQFAEPYTAGTDNALAGARGDGA
ncbi:EAL domain-containing protein [Paraburkholderia acidicola]|uniref:EAL domain-containing protein n=1 Tax=Paraburkholderia acidicola TaxID=1912599 RepID=A0ABV1LMV1_9BURK